MHMMPAPRPPITINLDRIVLSPITAPDIQEVGDLYGQARLAEDEAVVPGYITAALNDGYFHRVVGQAVHGARGARACAMKATQAFRLLGFFLTAPADRYAEASAHCTDACGELHWLYVHPNAKRQGLGRILFGRAMERLRQDNFTRVIVNLLDHKPGTRAFYEAMGLRLLGRRTEQNMRGGQIFTVPCLLMGHDDIARCIGAQPPLPQQAAACLVSGSPAP